MGEQREIHIFKSPLLPCISDRIYHCVTQDQGTWQSTWTTDARAQQPTLSQKLQGGLRVISK